MELRIVDRLLPEPRRWKYFTGGMWHNPWSIARTLEILNRNVKGKAR